MCVKYPTSEYLTLKFITLKYRHLKFLTLKCVAFNNFVLQKINLYSLLHGVKNIGRWTQQQDGGKS